MRRTTVQERIPWHGGKARIACAKLPCALRAQQLPERVIHAPMAPLRWRRSELGLSLPGQQKSRGKSLAGEPFPIRRSSGEPIVVLVVALLFSATAQTPF
jgi:hypothetical protein